MSNFSCTYLLFQKTRAAYKNVCSIMYKCILCNSVVQPKNVSSIQIGPGSLASFDVYLPIKKSYYTFVFNGVCHISYFVTKGYCFQQKKTVVQWWINYLCAFKTIRHFTIFRWLQCYKNTEIMRFYFLLYYNQNGQKLHCYRDDESKKCC